MIVSLREDFSKLQVVEVLAQLDLACSSTTAATTTITSTSSTSSTSGQSNKATLFKTIIPDVSKTANKRGNFANKAKSRRSIMFADTPPRPAAFASSGDDSCPSAKPPSSIHNAGSSSSSCSSSSSSSGSSRAGATKKPVSKRLSLRQQMSKRLSLTPKQKSSRQMKEDPEPESGEFAVLNPGFAGSGFIIEE